MSHLEIPNPDNQFDMPLFDEFGSRESIVMKLRNRLIPGEYFAIWTNPRNETFTYIVLIPEQRDLPIQFNSKRDYRS